MLLLARSCIATNGYLLRIIIRLDLYSDPTMTINVSGVVVGNGTVAYEKGAMSIVASSCSPCIAALWCYGLAPPCPGCSESYRIPLPVAVLPLMVLL